MTRLSMSVSVSPAPVAESAVVDEAMGMQLLTDSDWNGLGRWLYDTYRDYVYHICLRLMRQRDDAEDVAQDVFAKALAALPRFKQKAKFSTWLYQIAINTAMNELRRKRRLDQQLDDATAQSLPAPEHDDDQDLAQQLLNEALAMLPESYRLPLILREIEQRSRADIEAVLELSHEQLKSRLTRGRKKLDEAIEKVRLRYGL